MQDLDQQLASELKHLPESRFTIADTMAAGRLSVRRRRLAAGAAGLAAVLVVGGSAWLAAAGSHTTPESSQVTGEPTSGPTPNTPADDHAVEDDGPLVVKPNGRSVINPDAEVLEQDEYTTPSGAVVDIYQVRVDGGEYYAYLLPGSAGSTSLPAQGLTLQEWVDLQFVGPEIPDDGWVRFDDGSHLAPVLGGLTIVRQEPDPGLGENFAGAQDPTALAEVELDGTTFYLAVRQFEGGPAEAISFRRDKTIRTFEQFRTFTLNQYDNIESGTNEPGGSEGLR